MEINRKALFLKSWLWSLIGGGSFAAVFWFLNGVIHILQSLHNVSVFTIVLICVSLVGNFLGAGLVVWRVSEKYQPTRHKKTMERYWEFSIAALLIAAGLITYNTPLTIAIIGWNVVPALCVLWAIPVSSSVKTKT
jgi:hypothetical protein